ncbi:hypothetical protein GGR52DRAFT_88042 [Hypoxylon sp. FL1284]|nr:hypothetical protein GGR52DRAFT_88042 [Hypoxylon sp. FL1284]
MLARPARRLAILRTTAQRSYALAQPPLAARLQRRFSSSQSQPSAREGSLNATFFKTFGRPMVKVFLLAVFVYQLAYFFWKRADHEDVKSDMRATISALEKRIEELEKAK